MAVIHFWPTVHRLKKWWYLTWHTLEMMQILPGFLLGRELKKSNSMSQKCLFDVNTAYANKNGK